MMSFLACKLLISLPKPFQYCESLIKYTARNNAIGMLAVTESRFKEGTQ